jgi:hypothetical protein
MPRPPLIASFRRQLPFPHAGIAVMRSWGLPLTFSFAVCGLIAGHSSDALQSLHLGSAA